MKITPQFLILTAFNFLVFSTPLYFRFQNEELFEFNKMILVYAGTVVIAFLWLARMITAKKIIVTKTPLDFPIAVFVFSQFVSTIFSIHPYTSLLGYYSRFNGGLLSTICYVILFYAFVSNIRKKDLGVFFLSTLFSGLLVSIYGILEHFGHSVSCLLLPGPNRSFGVDCWVQKVQERVFATFGQPNWLAAYAVTLLPLSLVASTQKTLSVLKRSFLVLTTLSLFLVLLYTRSRSGILSLGVGAGIFGLGSLLLYRHNAKELLQKLHVQSVGITIACLCILGLFIGTSFTPSLSEILRSKNTTSQDASINNNQEQQVVQEAPAILVNRLEEGGTDSGQIRKIVWTGALQVWKRYPIIGSGVETFGYSYYQDRVREHNDVSEWDFLYNKAHNELLNFLANSGLVGLLSYLSIFFVLTYISTKILFSQNYSVTEKLVVVALISGQAGLFTSNFFGFSTVTVNLLMYLFFAITCIIYIDKKDLSEKVKVKKRVKNDSIEGTQYFGIGMAGIICLLLLFKIYNYWDADRSFAQSKNYFAAGQYQYGIENILAAIDKSPQEAIYFDTLSDQYSKLVVHFASAGETTTAAQIASETVLASNQTLQLNSRHLNFYKTRARVMVALSTLDELYFDEAKSTLEQAIQLSPTDPKLIYTLAVIEHTTGDLETALDLYKQAIQLKPDYERVYWKISELHEARNEYATAIEVLTSVLDDNNPNNGQVLEKIKQLEEKIKDKK